MKDGGKSIVLLDDEQIKVIVGDVLSHLLSFLMLVLSTKPSEIS